MSQPSPRLAAAFEYARSGGVLRYYGELVRIFRARLRDANPVLRGIPAGGFGNLQTNPL